MVQNDDHGKDDAKADLIDQNLRRVYDSVLSEDVPDRFAKLLAQLQAGEVPSSDTDDEHGPEGNDE
ncbi:NepR family anti-sigma factor [Jannaschia ovalis]|uniref:NepR family anti-sigma factor n=1 Tax=Jannaschia ovalis TaxID=3038773 RepID=A0ABY8L8L6_9RHOB|nr:NepR family anti-sigma factor [Jannaschia sp. GRR-S6-38]WGH77707.1 NepR family anti-sigma factor [Jannaschia sp. GRR-S6-38]